MKLTETTSIAIVAERYEIRKSTISNIKKNREKILQFQQEMTDMGMKTAKVMKLGDDEQHDKAVYLWFKQKWMEGMLISGPILNEKAKQLHKMMQGNDSSFSGSIGWQWRFCKRHGIHNISLQGEKLSADPAAVDEFVSSFSALLATHQLSLDQVFNCDKTGLNFCLLRTYYLDLCKTGPNWQCFACIPNQGSSLTAILPKYAN